MTVIALSLSSFAIVGVSTIVENAATWAAITATCFSRPRRSVILFHSSAASFMACSAVFLPAITAWQLLSSAVSYSLAPFRLSGGTACSIEAVMVGT